MQTKNTQQLLIEAKEVNEESFSLLLSETIKKIKPAIKQCFGQLKEEDFMDSIQIANVKTYKKLDSFREESSFSTWYYTVLKNEVLNTLNIRNNIFKHETSLDQLTSDARDENEYDNFTNGFLQETVMDNAYTILEQKDNNRELKRLLDTVLDKLGPSSKMVIELAYVKGLSYKEIAEEMKIPIGSVMSKIYYSKQYAQKLIRQNSHNFDVREHETILK